MSSTLIGHIPRINKLRKLEKVTGVQIRSRFDPIMLKFPQESVSWKWCNTDPYLEFRFNFQINAKEFFMTDQTDITKIAEAAAEVSKLGTQAVKTSEKILRGFAKILGEPAKDAAGLIGDSLKFLRWERQLRYVDRYNKILEERGIVHFKAVPPKFALPMISQASLEENDELQDLWARLTANAMDPNFKLELRYAYIEIIKSLNPLDVKMLGFFYEALKKDPIFKEELVTDYSLKKEQICAGLGVSENEYNLSVYNLFRVQCLAPAVMESTRIMFGGEPTTIFKGAKAITMTPLGVNFVKACIEDDSKGLTEI